MRTVRLSVNSIIPWLIPWFSPHLFWKPCKLFFLFLWSFQKWVDTWQSSLCPLFSIPVSSVFIPPHLWGSGLKLVQGALPSISIQFPVQSDEVQVGARWIMVPLCRPPPSWLSSLFPSHCTTSVPVGIVVARWTHPYFLLSHCQPLPYRHSIFHRGSSFGDSQIILRSSWVWLSPFSRLSNWGMKLFSESQHCIPGLQNCSQCSFHCSSTNIPAHSIGEKMSVALLVYCDVLSFSSLLKFNMLQLME